MNQRYLPIEKINVFNGKINSINELVDCKTNSFSKNLIIGYEDILNEHFFAKKNDDKIDFSAICSAIKNNERQHGFGETIFLLFILPYLTLHAVDESQNDYLFKLINNQYKNECFIYKEENQKIVLTLIQFNDDELSNEQKIFSSEIEILNFVLFQTLGNSPVFYKYKSELDKLRRYQRCCFDYGMVSTLMMLDKRYLLQDIIALAHNAVYQYINTEYFNVITFHFILKNDNELNTDLSFVSYTENSTSFYNKINRINGFDFSQFCPIFENWKEKIKYRNMIFRKSQITI